MSEEHCISEEFVRTCLTRLQSVGLVLVAESSFISLVAVVALFGLITRNVIRYHRHSPVPNWRLIQTPADAYVMSLFVADLLQAIGTTMDVKWVHSGVVQIGHYCTAEGTIQQLGQTGTAIATSVLAVHTFVVVWTRKGAQNLTVALCVITATWLYNIVYVVISVSTKPDYYNPDPWWCWIGDQYMNDKITGEYMWLWATVFISFMSYLPLFLWSRGHITVNTKHCWKVRLHWKARPENSTDTTIRSRPDAPSLSLLAYPLAYSMLVLPVTMARWIKFTGHNVPDAATFFALFLHRSFGVVNVLLLLSTRPTLLLFMDPRTLGGDSSARLVHRTDDLRLSLSDARSITSVRTAKGF